MFPGAGLCFSNLTAQFHAARECPPQARLHTHGVQEAARTSPDEGLGIPAHWRQTNAGPAAGEVTVSGLWKGGEGWPPWAP